MIRALVIAPYEGLFQIIKEIEKEISGFELQVELGDLHEGVAIALSTDINSFDVIISRGGTASLIKEAVEIPVIDIQVSGYDVLRILTLVKSFSGKAAIVGFQNISQGASTICNLLDLDINTITITKDIEVKSTLEKLKEDGYEVVIGDVVTTRVAKELGLHGILITSGRESIIDSLGEARRIVQLFSRLKKDVTLYKSIIDTDVRGVIIMADKEKILYKNRIMNKESSLENSVEVKSIVKQAFENHLEQTILISLGGSFWKVTAKPKDNVVVIFFEKEFNQKRSPAWIGKGNVIEISIEVPQGLIAGKSEQTQNLLNKIDSCSQKDLPIWIKSEYGNGKELIARYIHSKRNSNHPFILIHCDLLTPSQLRDLIEGGYFQKYHESTIYFRMMDRLNQESQQLLYSQINGMEGKSINWIISSDNEISCKIKTGEFNRDLFYALARKILFFPPLRDRKADIENLVQLFISESHTKGKQVVGIREEALEELIRYDWPGNVKELKYVVDQAILESKTYYIEKNVVESVISQVGYQTPGVAKGNIDMSGTLEEIEKRIIHRVLDEEKMNQSKAAKRLGINRSTLWRKLK